MASMTESLEPHRTSSSGQDRRGCHTGVAATNRDTNPARSHDSIELQSLLPSSRNPNASPGNTSGHSDHTPPMDSRVANVASKAPVTPKQSRRKYSRWQRFQRYCNDNWVLEFMSMLLSIVCTVAIAVVLKAFE